MSKVGIIDIGSHSVRLLLQGKKYLNSTHLAEGLLTSGTLSLDAMERTKNAIVSFYNFALENNVSYVYAFATEAVRSAKNSNDFIELLQKENIKIEIISPQNEAKLGFYGAYVDGNVAVLDIGGASSELAVGDKNGLSYSYSLPLGCIKLKEYEENDFDRLYSFVKEKIKNYGTVPQFDKFITIGGTTSTLVAINLKMSSYDTKMVHNATLTRREIEKIVRLIFSTPLEERKNIIGLPEKRAQIIAPGGTLLLAIMDYLKIDKITVSENDNLEGYALLNNLEI